MNATSWLSSCFFAALPATAFADAPEFSQFYVDLNYGGNGKPGWVRDADVDQDGDKDLVAGGGGALFVYENDGSARGWIRYGSLDGSGNMGCNGAVIHDVDNDGYPDVVAAKFNGDLGWWENPATPANPLSSTTWAFHRLFQNTTGHYMHDLERKDLDGDGQAHEFIANLNKGYWNSNIKILWFRIPATPTNDWDVFTIETSRGEGTPHGHAGIDVGDINGDGHLDIAYANGWYEAPDIPETAAWTWHEVTTFYGVSNTLLRDLDGDTKLDLVLAAGHHGNGVRWFECPANPIADTWIEHIVDNGIVHPEGLQVYDADGDGDLDLVASELFFGEAAGEPDWSDEAHNIYFYENTGTPMIPAWQETNIAPDSYPSHLIQLVDINDDGHLDLISESAGHSVISYYENKECTPTPEDIAFSLTVIDPAYAGNGRPGWSASGDFDGDGQIDVLSGGGGALQWYKAPNWTKFPVENPTTTGGNGGVVLDVDGDTDLDFVTSLFNGDLVWFENPGPASVTGAWTRRSIDTAITTFCHDIALGDIDGDTKPEIVALYVGGGVYWYDLPATPATAGAWPRTRILATINDPFVGLATGDIDGDNDIDVVASNQWFESPANPATPDWTGRTVFAAAVQNVTCYDVNGDNRLDVVAAEGFVHPNGRVLWAEAPTDPKTQAWTERIVGSNLDGPENIFAGDLNGDGFTDIVSGEMGTSDGFNDNGSNLTVFGGLNAGGTSWLTTVVALNVGVSARINPVDIDGDGDTDFTADGNAEDHIYLWENTTCESGAAPGAAATPVFAPPGGSFTTSMDVSAGTTTPGATIYYTTDGSNPDETSPVFPPTLTISSTTTLKARAYAPGLAPSEFAVAVFTALPPPGSGSLVLHLAMDEGTGPTANDLSGNGNHATINGAAWSTSAITCSTHSLDFDGASDLLDAGTFDVTTSAMTMATWIRLDDFDVGDARIISKAQGGIQVQDHYWMLSTDRPGGSGPYLLRFRLKTNGDTDTLVASSGELQAGTWTHVAAVYDGTEMRLYKDGIEVGSMPKSGPVTASPSAPVIIGNHPPAAGNKPFDGLIDEVRIYDFALSPAQLVELAHPATACAFAATPDLDDTDKDGSRDLLERALGTGVLAPGGESPVTLGTMEFNGDDYLTLRFPAVANATPIANGWLTTGVFDYRIELSTDLLFWSPATVTGLGITTSGVPAGFESLTFRIDDHSIAAMPRTWLRLSVRRSAVP